jgi:hypothetical protein
MTTDGEDSVTRWVGGLKAGDPEAVRRLRDRFEQALKDGRQPSIEDCLAAAEEPVRSGLLRELPAIELEYRGAAGEQPSSVEYHTRFPGRAELVEAVFARSAVTPTPRAPVSCVGAASRLPRETPTSVHATAALPPIDEPASSADSSTDPGLKPADFTAANALSPAGVHFFGDYEILREIARGGWASSFRPGRSASTGSWR